MNFIINSLSEDIAFFDAFTKGFTPFLQQHAENIPQPFRNLAVIMMVDNCVGPSGDG